MSTEKAQIVSLSELMSEKIGDGLEEDRQKSDTELKTALAGNPDDKDYFDLKNIEKDPVSEVSTEEDSKTESDDLTTLTASEKTENNQNNSNENSPEPQKQDKNDEFEYTSEQLRQSEMYKKTLHIMYDGSIDKIVEVGKDGNEVEVLIEDAFLDESAFNQLVKAKQAEIAEEASRDKVSVKGVSDFTKSLIEIDRKGGDISDLLEAKEYYSDPLDKLDMDTEAGQEMAVYLRMMATGQDEDSTRRLIASYKAEGIIEEKGRQAEAELREGLKRQLQLAEQAAEKEASERKELMKSYKKEIRSNLDKFQLNDNIKRKVTSLATAQDEKGRFEIDKVYREYQANPELAADLALFLLDKKEYDNQVSNRKVEETKLESAKKSLRVVRSSGDARLPETNKGSTRGDGTISISALQDL